MRVRGTTHDRLIYVDITVSDLYIETAIRIDANPRFVMHRCPLSAVIRQGNKITLFTLQTLRKTCLAHESTSTMISDFYYTLLCYRWQDVVDL